MLSGLRLESMLPQLVTDPTRFRNGTFCVRWEGTVTPDTTVQGGQFGIGLGEHYRKTFVQLLSCCTRRWFAGP
jgi:hypothetical protein